ncbi:MAG TPA: hypothetical protein DCY20_08115 [Firmicutes bacterium]|nr:hypothetical protein [Bacillota bacterium]
MKICVIDAQGAGIGQTIIKRIRKQLPQIELIAIGTNKIAMTNMLEAGAISGLYGEEAIIKFFEQTCIDAIIGPIGILVAGGIKGEITLGISQAIFTKSCPKYIIPLKRHGIFIPGTSDLLIKDMIQDIIDQLKNDL